MKSHAQYPSEISFEINQQKFLVKVNYTTNFKTVVAFFRDSVLIKSDTLLHNEFTKLYFRGFNKDTLVNIRLIGFKNGYKNAEYVYASKYIEIEKTLSLDLDPSYYDKYCKLYEYNKKLNNFNSVNGFDWIRNPEFLKSNPHYFTSTQRFDCEQLSYITTLFLISNLKIYPKAQMNQMSANDSFGTMVVELYEIDKKNENKKTMIDRQVKCTMQPVCYGPSHVSHFNDGLYWEKHCVDFKAYRLLGSN
ncbi:MAG: hypothetical protein Q8M29_09960 [Bacteroidota bacterium]|nr:hypothetical protein [Bacteroidota bacterium]